MFGVPAFRLTPNRVRDLLIGATLLFLIAQNALPAVRAFAQGATDASSTRGIALATAFTYQGRLVEGANPPSGTYDFEFRLFDAPAAGTPIGALVPANGVNVADGLFSVPLDFGAVFQGEQRWLEVRVKPTGGSFETLTPRQNLTAVPQALFALNVPWSGVTGVPLGFQDGVDNDTTYGAIAPLTLNAGSFGLSAAGCVAGEVWKYNGAQWTCEPDAVGAPGAHDHYGSAWSGSSAYRGLSVTNSSTDVGSSGLYGSTTAEFAAGVAGDALDGGVGVAGSSRVILNGGDQRAIGVVGRVCDPGPTGPCFFGDGGPNRRWSGVYGESTQGHGVSGLANWDEGGSGVYGRSDGSPGSFNNFVAGVVGEGNKTGVIGRGDRIGVWGDATGLVDSAGFLPQAGVVGVNRGTGCTNHNTSIDEYCVGVWGWATQAAATIGVYGEGQRVGVFGSAPTATGFAVYANGYTYSTGGYQTSDGGLKTDPAASAGLKEILALRPHSYRWARAEMDDGKRHQGLFAQDVMEVLPDLVTLVDGPGDAHYALNYVELIPVLIRAIQEQQAEIESLRSGTPASAASLAEGQANPPPSAASLANQGTFPAGESWSLPGLGLLGLLACAAAVQAGRRSRGYRSRLPLPSITTG